MIVSASVLSSQEILDRLPCGGIIYDFSTCSICAVNSEVAILFNCQSEEFTGRSIQDLFSDQQQAVRHSTFSKSHDPQVNGNALSTSEIQRLVLDNGSQVEVEVKFSVWNESEGLGLCLIVAQRKLETSIKSALDVLYISELQFENNDSLFEYGRSAFEQTKDILNPSGFFIAINECDNTITLPFVWYDSEYETTDYRFVLEPHISDDLFDGILTKTISDFDLYKLGFFKRLNIQKQNVDLVVTIVRTNGEAVGAICFWRENGDNPLNEKTILLLESISYQTANYIQRSEIQATNTMLAEIVGNSNIAIFNAIHGEIDLWNRGAESMFGYSEQEAIGTDPLLLFPIIQRNNLVRRYTNIYNNEGDVHFNTAIRKSNGQVVDVLAQVMPIKENDRVIGFSAVLQDVSSLVNAQNELSQLNLSLESRVAQRTKELIDTKSELAKSLEKEKQLSEMKSKFVSTASHQFRTPLTVIQSSASLIAIHMKKLSEENTVKIESSVDRIVSQVDKMTRMMNELLILGKIESGGLVLNPVKFDLIGAIEDSIRKMELIHKQHTIEIEVIGTSRSVELDKMLFDDSFNNVLSNALKYSKNSGSPKVVVRFLPQDQFEIEVEDYGIGIPSEELDKIFEPFYRAKNTNKIAGTGLGMAISRDYTRLNGGQMSVESKLGVGTKVILKYG